MEALITVLREIRDALMAIGEALGAARPRDTRPRSRVKEVKIKAAKVVIDVDNG